jgi:hypothetical protein
MFKLLRISILIATVAVPLWAARDQDAARGLRKVLGTMVLVTVAYWFAVAFLTPEP